MLVLLLGGTGFIGRHTAAALIRAGHSVVIGTRFPSSAGRRLPLRARRCQRRPVRFEALVQPERWVPLLTDVDVVINCVGILRARWRESYEAVHHLAVAALADACMEAGVLRLIHLSALGLHREASSGFLRSKLRGELALRAGPLQTAIVRPSLLDGPDGFGSRWVRRMANWPVHCVPAGATGLMAPLHVDDLAEALAKICALETWTGVREFELGGSELMTMPAYLATLRRSDGLAAARIIEVPQIVARALSHVCDLLHVTPFSFGHLELLARDNVPTINALPSLLGRVPTLEPRVQLSQVGRAAPLQV